MHFPLSFVAESRRLEHKAFEAFAVRHESTYGVFNEHGKWMVSNWHVDDLCKAFKKAAEAGYYVDSDGFVQFVSQPTDSRTAVLRLAKTEGQQRFAVDVADSAGFVVESADLHKTIKGLEEAGVVVRFSWIDKAKATA